MVSCKKKFAISHIVECNCKHSIQISGEISSVFFICVNDDFGVCFRLKYMPPGFQFPSHFPKIIDLPVEHNANCSVFVEYRLLSSLNVYYREAAHSHCDSILNAHSVVVRSTVDNRIAHLLQLLECRR